MSQKSIFDLFLKFGTLFWCLEPLESTLGLDFEVWDRFWWFGSIGTKIPNPQNFCDMTCKTFCAHEIFFCTRRNFFAHEEIFLCTRNIFLMSRIFFEWLYIFLDRAQNFQTRERKYFWIEWRRFKNVWSFCDTSESKCWQKFWNFWSEIIFFEWNEKLENYLSLETFY